MSLNKIMLIGNLGKDPEMRFLPGSGRPVASFSIATNRRYKIEGELREEVEWFSVVAFGRLAEICQEFLKKGRQVYIGGRIKTRTWVDPQGGKHYRTEVVTEELQLIGPRPNGNGQSKEQEAVPEPEPDPDPEIGI